MCFWRHSASDGMSQGILDSLRLARILAEALPRQAGER